MSAPAVKPTAKAAAPKADDLDDLFASL